MTADLRFKDRALPNPFYSSAPVSLNQASFPYLNLTCPTYQKIPTKQAADIGEDEVLRVPGCASLTLLSQQTLVPNGRPIYPTALAFLFSLPLQIHLHLIKE